MDGRSSAAYPTTAYANQLWRMSGIRARAACGWRRWSCQNLEQQRTSCLAALRGWAGFWKVTFLKSNNWEWRENGTPNLIMYIEVMVLRGQKRQTEKLGILWNYLITGRKQLKGRKTIKAPATTKKKLIMRWPCKESRTNGYQKLSISKGETLWYSH